MGEELRLLPPSALPVTEVTKLGAGGIAEEREDSAGVPQLPPAQLAKPKDTTLGAGASTWEFLLRCPSG